MMLIDMTPSFTVILATMQILVAVSAAAILASGRFGRNRRRDAGGRPLRRAQVAATPA